MARPSAWFGRTDALLERAPCFSGHRPRPRSIFVELSHRSGHWPTLLNGRGPPGLPRHRRPAIQPESKAMCLRILDFWSRSHRIPSAFFQPHDFLEQSALECCSSHPSSSPTIAAVAWDRRRFGFPSVPATAAHASDTRLRTAPWGMPGQTAVRCSLRFAAPFSARQRRLRRADHALQRYAPSECGSNSLDKAPVGPESQTLRHVQFEVIEHDIVVAGVRFEDASPVIGAAASRSGLLSFTLALDAERRVRQGLQAG